jgi:hypothetical protein
MSQAWIDKPLENWSIFVKTGGIGGAGFFDF